MNKVTLKELKNMIKNGAVNITNMSYEDMQVFIRNTSYEKIYYSKGIYGINGGAIKDNNNKIYVIIGRNTNLFMIF